MISSGLLSELEQESVGTRKTLERVPDGKFGWKPHEKSFTMGALASHLATILGWGAMTIQTESLDINPPGGPGFPPPMAVNREELLAMFDKSVSEFRAALEGADSWNDHESHDPPPRATGCIFASERSSRAFGLRALRRRTELVGNYSGIDGNGDELETERQCLGPEFGFLPFQVQELIGRKA
jgi:hypothetical protein